MRLDDFVMLGTTVPEVISDGREAVCSAGYSDEFGSLLRLYPLAKFDAPKRWHTYRVEIERNSRDRRAESWALRGDRRIAHSEINGRAFSGVGRIGPTDLCDAIERNEVASIKEANERRLSLAFLRPQNLGLRFDYNPAAPDSPQLKLFSGTPEPTGSKRFTYTPRLTFLDQEEWPHDLQLREWGAFEFLRKFPEDHAGLSRNLKLDDEPVLLIGNHAQHRSSWLVIAVLHVAPQLSLLTTNEALSA